MENTRREMIGAAVVRYGKVLPCGVKESLGECFTRVNGKIIFWFNDESGNTHVEVRRIE